MFYLKQYNTRLLSFEMMNDPLEGQSCSIIDIVDASRNLLPIGLKLTDEGLMSWLRSRVIPKNRAFVESFLTKNGLSRRDIIGIIRICMGLSLNDSYWIVEDEFEGKFEDYNLYEHDFVKALSLIAYTGYGTSRLRGFSSSPEFTTNGMLRKAWRRLNNKILLFKGGTSGFANTGNEPYSEFYAAQIAEQMGIKHVSYGLAMWKRNLCSTCELFSDIDHAYVPIYHFMENATISRSASLLRDISDDAYDAFVDMMVFDALIYNEDRHFGNFGLMVDNRTNQPYALAPVFDNGMSLFNFAMLDDLENIDEYAKTRRAATGATFESIVSELITPRQKEMLRKMIGFKFNDHSSYKWPAKRKKIIENFLQKRVAELMKL